MSEFNSCSKLTSTPEFKEGVEKYEELLAGNQDPFAFMLKMQYDLQQALKVRRPNSQDPAKLLTVGEKFEWLRENKQAFDDEYRELIDALPGMSLPEKDRSAVWKKWKDKHEAVRSRTFDDLTEEDMDELKFELVDSFHFYMNMFFAIGLTPEELFVYYYAKNAENHRRSQNGY